MRNHYFYIYIYICLSLSPFKFATMLGSTISIYLHYITYYLLISAVRKPKTIGLITRLSLPAVTPLSAIVILSIQLRSNTLPGSHSYCILYSIHSRFCTRSIAVNKSASRKNTLERLNNTETRRILIFDTCLCSYNVQEVSIAKRIIMFISELRLC